VILVDEALEIIDAAIAAAPAMSNSDMKQEK